LDLIKYKKFQWLNVSEINQDVIGFLKKKYHFHSLDLEDCVSGTQRSKIDEYDKYLFIVLHFPYYNDQSGYFISLELDIFISDKYIITLNKNGHWPILDKLRQAVNSSIKKRHDFLNLGPSFFLYKVLCSLFDNVFPQIDKLNKDIFDMEETIFRQTDRPQNILKDIMTIKRNIINMRRIFLPQRAVIASLNHKLSRFNNSELDLYFDDIVDKVEKLWSNLETAKEVLSSLQDIYESIISHNINNVMKTLTVFSVIMLPLTLIAGIYGMNVPLPFSSQSGTFLFLVLGMFLIVAIMLSVFKWKRWL
jgi:magnesium transporter